MSLIFAGICSHAPGITARPETAEKSLRDGFYASLDRMRDELKASRPDVLIVVAAEHFGNFFMNNMPAFALGMGNGFHGPIEDEAFLKIKKRKAPSDRRIAQKLIEIVQQDVDVAFCEEWTFDHGIAVPLHFLNPDDEIPFIPGHINCQAPPLPPIRRAWAFGEAIRKAADAIPERVALVGTGGISHWPATPDSGRIDEAWDRDFLDKWARNDKQALLSYTDADVYRDAGPGGFEIRTLTTVAAAARGRGTVHFYAPIPVFAVGCTTATMSIA
ncbi:extradiol ring-cleavage dioxygenase [Castellaniella sp.]|uniref:DODA-type extradiol aromatic ring-opening family dioxygenase n=1 Tax=Castellaniella sp. TaxID=1955812 RepID=UPI002AFFA6A6|nr:extradiol ring-cleavage dioxygenase [Castellaniella sp.]